MKILTVDDDDIALELLSSALRSAGYNDVTTAASASEALTTIAASDQPFEAFLLDIRMPGMDGIELCSRIKEMHQYQSTPVIMITAMQERHFIERAFAAGAIDYISKPFDMIELGVRIGIAERLSTQAHRVDESLNQVAFISSRTGVGIEFDAKYPIEIRSVPRVIGMTAMENYLLRLSYSMAVKSNSIVFSIAGFRALHAQIGPADSYDLLSETAAAIVCGLKHINHLVTYVGDGQFVAVMHGHQSSMVGDETLLAIQAEIDENELCLSSGHSCPITIAMGESYSPRILGAWNRLNLLLQPLGPSIGSNTEPTRGKSKTSNGIGFLPDCAA